jgi:hypothetical protein
MVKRWHVHVVDQFLLDGAHEGIWYGIALVAIPLPHRRSARIAFRPVEIVGFSRLCSTRHEDPILSALGCICSSTIPYEQLSRQDFNCFINWNVSEQRGHIVRHKNFTVNNLFLRYSENRRGSETVNSFMEIGFSFSSNHFASINL